MVQSDLARIYLLYISAISEKKTHPMSPGVTLSGPSTAQIGSFLTFFQDWSKLALCLSPKTVLCDEKPGIFLAKVSFLYSIPTPKPSFAFFEPSKPSFIGVHTWLVVAHLEIHHFGSKFANFKKFFLHALLLPGKTTPIVAWTNISYILFKKKIHGRRTW